ncbi:MAG: nitrilase-related carbon-nitrogen hydrolase [Planctomycetota bacterium]
MSSAPTRLRIAAAALDQTPLDWAGNLDRCRRALTRAREEGAQIVLLPELALSGYGCEDAFYQPHIELRAWQSLEALLPDTLGLVVGVGLPCLHRGVLYNVAALCVDGKLAGFVAKQHLAGDGIHYEPRWFRPWPEDSRARIDARGLPHWSDPAATDDGDVPIGDLVFEVGRVRIGFEICEDAWVADRPGTRLAARAVDVLLNPSASHFAFGRRVVRERLVSESSRVLHAVYVYANLLGNEAGRVLYDGGSMVAARGEIVAVAPRFSFREVELALATVDLSAVRRDYRGAASARATVVDEPGTCIELEGFTWRDVGHATPGPAARPMWETSRELAFEEFTRAVALGLFDYLRKSRSGGFVVSLSGGADSATVACLVEVMVHFGVEQLGREGFERALRRAPGEATLRALLTTVYQATENSSETTRSAAATLADGLGATHYELDVQGLVSGYRARVEAAVGRALTWQQDDITLQNLQARVRSPSAWALANLQRAILLSTSNRSEAAVGYATMDGDTSGGLSPIAGVDKSFILVWIQWMWRTGPEGRGPIESLAEVAAQRPTAELRPPSEEQRDEDDLMPYAILDAIEELSIRDRLAPAGVLDALEGRFPEHPRGALADWVRRFYRLWVQNQWKRERLAPSFHLDDENLDPKTWCRYPILGGDWHEELNALTP